MSDPMTNSEVEDVLSSIRRLVSDENRAGPASSDADKPVADRLVLTPSLRISESVEPDTDVTTASAESDESVPQRSASSDEHADSPGGETTDEPLLLGDALPKANIQNDSETEAAASHGYIGQIQTDAPDTGAPQKSDDGDVTATVAPTPSMTLPEKIATLETLIADRAEEWEPDQAGAGDNAGKKPPALNWDSAKPFETDPSIEDEREETAAPAGLADSDQVTGGDASATTFQSSSLSDGDQILPLAPANTSEGASDPVNSPAARNELEPDISDEPLQGVSEEALRKMIADVVRQELQGELGERVTRNIRKLVRRELHRALTAQDLE